MSYYFKITQMLSILVKAVTMEFITEMSHKPYTCTFCDVTCLRKLTVNSIVISNENSIFY